MRIGGRRVDWTMDEVAYLIESAGAVPEREICARLGRSAESVRHMARRLRKQGVPVSLRHHEPRTVVCPACGRRSATARETGICRPCQLRRRLAKEEAEMSDLMARMPAAARAAYERSESHTGVPRVTEPRPARPRKDPNATRYERDRDADAYAVALEQWEVRRLTRQLRTEQRRRERMAAKLKKFL